MLFDERIGREMANGGLGFSVEVEAVTRPNNSRACMLYVFGFGEMSTEPPRLQPTHTTFQNTFTCKRMKKDVTFLIKLNYYQECLPNIFVNRT